MKRLFLLLALVGMIATSCEESGIEEPSNPTEQPDDNTDEEQPGDDENEDDEESPVFEIDGPGKYTIGAEGGSIDVVVTTNLEYRLEVSEDAQSWLTIADTRAVRTERLTISVSPNNTDSERTATISVFDGADNKVFSFTLTQECVDMSQIIKFVDNNVKTICLVNWDLDGDAELSVGEAELVTDIDTKFQGKDIMSFEEFKYFIGVTTIVNEAFKGCTDLVKIAIPYGVGTIGTQAFSDCKSLVTVNCNPGTPPVLGTNVFENNASDIKIYVYDECVDLYKATWGEYADIIYSNGSHSAITTTIEYTTSDGKVIPVNGIAVVSNTYEKGVGKLVVSGVCTQVPERTFYGCSNLTGVTLPDSITTIGGGAFRDCGSLTTVTIGDSVTTIGDSAFNGCDSLTSITIPDSVTTIGHYAFYNCSSLTSINIPDSVTTIGRYVFYGCSSLTSITIPDSVTTIGAAAFNGCSSLTSITIPDSVTTIEDDAFRSCDSLTSITIPDSVTTIGAAAFNGCSSLTSITIPDSVTTIGICAFVVCDSLTEFNGKFASEDGRCLIVDGVLNSFAPYGLTEYTIPDSVTEIGEYAFGEFSSLTSITIPDSVTTIGYGAFCSCDSLTSITIPDSVTSIGYLAFYNCNSLTEFKGSGVSSDGLCIINNKGVLFYFLGKALTEYIIPDGVTSIGNGAFSGCSSLTSITIPDSVTSIGDAAFEGCSSLTSVTIPDSVTKIGDSAFKDCSSLTSITIPDGVTNIGYAAFRDCSSLTSITIPDSVTLIGEDAFEGCSSLTSITIPDSVTWIGREAFKDCDSLTSITIPDSVTWILEYAFYRCDSLTSVYCKATTPLSLGSQVFDYNHSGRKIYVPTESVEAYKAAEGWSNYADAIFGYDFNNGVVVE